MIRDHIGTMRVRSRAGKGGEWDALRSLPRRTYRRLCGAGYVTTDGDAPDVFAESWNDWRGSDLSVCDVVAAWAKEALREIDECRRQSRRQSRQRRERLAAERAGVRTYFEYRNLRAIALGFGSYRAMRSAKGWAG